MIGPGRRGPVVELVLDADIAVELCPIVIHGGAEVTTETWAHPGGGWSRGYRTPKRDLVSIVQALLQTERISIVPRLPDARTLERELLAFPFEDQHRHGP